MKLRFRGTPELRAEIESLLAPRGVELVEAASPGPEQTCLLLEGSAGEPEDAAGPVVYLVRSDSAPRPEGICLRSSEISPESLLGAVGWAGERHELLRRLEIAGRASSRAEEILAHVTHEMRSPMTVISMATQLASNPRVSEEKRQKHLALLADSTRVLQTLINDILDFSKLDSGRLELSSIDFRLRDLLDHIAGGFRLLARKKGIGLECSVGPDVPDRLNGDPGRLRQVIANLLNNAVKFTERGGVDLIVLTETVREEEISLHFAARDTGIGISEEAQGRIFEPYVQADVSISRKFGGTGLGLAITRRLVEMMGGRIWVESRPGGGSTFRFVVRLKPERAAVEKPQEVALEGLRILLVDRNDASRERLRRQVAEWGMRAVSATDSVDAVKQLKDGHFDLLLVDLSTAGFPVLAELGAERLLEQTTVVVTTAAGQRGDGARCMELGAAGYLTGSVDDSDLRRALELCLGSTSPTRLVTRHSLRQD